LSFQDKIRNPDCELCPLHESAEYVCLMGSGSKKAKIMIVGEAPGVREDETHRAFVGPAGKLLRKTLLEAGIDPQETYITNAAKCRPPENRTPTRAEAKICSSTYLSQELKAVRPDYILPVGNAALQAVCRKSGITKHRGKLYTIEGGVALPTFHPAAVLRNPRYGDEFRADVLRLGRMVRGVDDGFKTKVKIASTKPALRALRERLLAGPAELSWDVETTGLESWRTGESHGIVSLAVSWRPDLAIFVPLFHPQSPWEDKWEEVLRYLKPGLEVPGVKYGGHNIKFDSKWFARYGVFTPQLWDTMLMAHMIDENRSKALKTLAQVVVGVDAWDIGEDVKDARSVPIKRLARYNGLDAAHTLRLYHSLREELLKEKRVARVYKRLMMPASESLTKVETIGLWCDVERTEKRLRKAYINQQKIMQRLIKKYGAPANINFNSPQQLGRWLFHDLKLPIVEETKTGAASTREAVLLHLARRHPAPKLILDYRLWTKRINTYLDPWLLAAREDSKQRIHSNYKLFGTVTGRLSSERPNLHQVPREPFMRTCLGAPPGWKFVEADFSQIELRLAAMLARETRMLRAFATGEDIHLKTAVEGTGKHPGDITKEERKLAKGINFGLLYDMGYKKLVEYLFENYGIEISEEAAKAWKRRFFESYPRLVSWHDRQRRLVHRYGRVSSAIGRVRHLPDVRSSNESVVAEAERQAINSPVQSLASDLMLAAMVRLDHKLPSRDARIVGTVHDAILLEVRESTILPMVQLIKSTMEDTSVVREQFGSDISVPIVAEVSVGQYWGQVEKELVLE
jgi:uracil-DNA glycosylase family 4